MGDAHVALYAAMSRVDAVGGGALDVKRAREVADALHTAAQALLATSKHLESARRGIVWEYMEHGSA